MAERLRQLASIIGQQNRLKSIRERNELDAKEFQEILFQDNSYDKYIQPIYNFFDNNKNIFTHHNIEGHSRPQSREQAVKMLLALVKYCKIDLINQPLKLVYTMWATTMYDGGIVTKSFLHYFLYTKSLILFQNHPKHEQFIADAISLKDIGCFGLTEFHHGSFSKQIQTQATYDHQRKEFVVTTQGTKGMKYWIGAAAEVANTSTIWAQLIIDGKSQGPHPFIVPLRCKKTHQVLPGVTIGDCGPKNGLNYIDNGFIILDNVRIPSYHLLGKLGSIDENGVYNTMIENKDMRFGFHMSPLSGGRGVISLIANAIPLKALTSALRYAYQRKQFDNSKKIGEVPIIDYPLTKMRLIPLLAQTIVQIYPGLQLARTYFGNAEIFNDLKFISQLHAISAAVKARTSWNSTNVIQQARSILGGYGYSSYSNFTSFFHDTDINSTWEGDNNMLLQQTSKYLMKTVSKQAKTKIIDLSFIWKPVALDEDKIVNNLRSVDTIEALLKDLLVVKYNNAKQAFDELSKQYKNKSELWLHFHPQVGNSLSLTFADYYIFTMARQAALKARNPKNKDYLMKCLLLWGFSLVEKQRYGSNELRRHLQKEIVILCEQLTEPSVLATDILVPSTHITGSIFSNFNGEGLQDFISHLYSSQDTFTRVPYFGQIIAARNSK